MTSDLRPVFVAPSLENTTPGTYDLEKLGWLVKLTSYTKLHRGSTHGASFVNALGDSGGTQYDCMAGKTLGFNSVDIR